MASWLKIRVLWHQPWAHLADWEWTQPASCRLLTAAQSWAWNERSAQSCVFLLSTWCIYEISQPLHKIHGVLNTHNAEKRPCDLTRICRVLPGAWKGRSALHIPERGDRKPRLPLPFPPSRPVFNHHLPRPVKSKPRDFFQHLLPFFSFIEAHE